MTSLVPVDTSSWRACTYSSPRAMPCLAVVVRGVQYPLLVSLRNSDVVVFTKTRMNEKIEEQVEKLS